MLSEALKRKDECFDFACRAASGCFDGRFILEEKIFWVGVFVELWENSGVEAWRPRELFELCGQRRAEALLRSKLMWHHVLAFLFVRVLFFFNDNGLLAEPMGLRHLLHGFGVLAKGFIIIKRSRMDCRIALQRNSSSFNLLSCFSSSSAVSSCPFPFVLVATNAFDVPACACCA